MSKVRFILLTLFLIVVSLVIVFFQRLGLGEATLIVAVLALAFAVETVKYLLKQILKGYQGR